MINLNLNFFNFEVPANQGGSPPSSQRQPQKMDVKPVETGSTTASEPSKPGAPAATPTAPASAPTSAASASPTPPTTKSS